MQRFQQGDLEAAPAWSIGIGAPSHERQQRLICARPGVPFKFHCQVLGFPFQKLDRINPCAAMPESLMVYPNPSSGRFFIAVKDETIISLECYDVNGRLLQASASLPGNTMHEWHLDVPAGLYLLKAVMGNGKVKVAKVAIGMD